MASNKKVTLEVAVKTQEAQIDALEKKVDKLRQQKLQMKIDADTQALDAVSQKLRDAENKLSGLKAKVDVDDSEIETGSSGDAVLIAEISNDKAENITSLGMIVKSKKKRSKRRFFAL